MSQIYFDRTGKVPRPSYHQLGRELGAFLLDHPPLPDARRLPHGDGHVVLVLPAFLTGDWQTKSLRRFLRRCGFRAKGWGLGTNWGPTPRILDGLQRRLTELCAWQGGPVSLIGISLGGVLARNLAHSHPQNVKQLITLASPWRLPTASTIEPLVEIASRFYSQDVDLARLRGPLPVPATSLYTRDDGIVAWQTCFAADAACDTETAIEVGGAHVSIGCNPQALALVAQLLTGGVGPTPQAAAGG